MYTETEHRRNKKEIGECMQIVQKIIEGILILCIGFSVMFLPVSVQAAKQQNNQGTQPEIPVSIRTKNAVPGKKVTVKVAVGESTGICAMDLYVDYDAKKLTYVSCQKGKNLNSSAMTIVGEPQENSRISFSYADLGTGIQKKTTVMKITFKVKKKAKGKAKLKLSVGAFADSQSNSLEYKIVNGAVKVKKSKGKS